MGAATGAKDLAKCKQQKQLNTNSPANASERELIEASRAVALAKLREYERQAKRLARLVRQGIVAKSAAVDRLYDIATAHALVIAHSETCVQSILSDAFADAAFRPMSAETAA